MGNTKAYLYYLYGFYGLCCSNKRAASGKLVPRQSINKTQDDFELSIL